MFVFFAFCISISPSLFSSFSRCLLRNIVAEFPIFPIHCAPSLPSACGIQTVFHLALPLWPFYYDFVDFAFPAKNNIGATGSSACEERILCKTPVQDSPLRLSSCSRGSLPVDRALERVSVLGMLEWRHGGNSGLGKVFK